MAVTDEPSLLARARAGDREAFNELVRLYVDDVYSVTLRILGDRDLAQDASQDAFVSAFRAIERFRGEASFRTWLLRIATNAARSVGRRKTRRREVRLESVSDHPSEGADPDARAVQRHEAARAEAMLQALPEKQRLAVSLRIHQGLSYHEIGKVLDCTEGAARVNYHLGVKRLREQMK